MNLANPRHLTVEANARPSVGHPTATEPPPDDDPSIDFDRRIAEATVRLSRRPVERLPRLVTADVHPYHWVLDSPAMADVLTMARRLANAPRMPVLIEGERGVGVLELARLIHDEDPRCRGQKFRTIAASVVGPAEIRGRAPDGTLFIEDVENLRPPAQQWVAKLLAGRSDSGRAPRVIAGSRYGAPGLLRLPGLGQELIHELDVGRLAIPPLRERPTDILLLARRFLGQCARRSDKAVPCFTEGAERKLLAHTYPVNVRELRNIVERAAALTTSHEVNEGAIVIYDGSRPPSLQNRISYGCVGSDQQAHLLPTLAEMERDYLIMLIRQLKGRRTAISRAMGVSYPTVLKKIARHGLDVAALAADAPVVHPAAD